VAANGSGGKREAAALALAGGLSLRQAARQCGVGQRTVFRWHTDPAFRQRFAQLRTQLFDRAVGRLSRLGGKAARELGNLLASADERTRLGAAKAILALGCQVRDAEEITQRLEELERRLAALDRQGGGL
jgi:hypothetical protein